MFQTISSRDVYIEVLRKKRDKCRKVTKKNCHHHQFQLHKAMKVKLKIKHFKFSRFLFILSLH